MFVTIRACWHRGSLRKPEADFPGTRTFNFAALLLREVAEWMNEFGRNSQRCTQS